jgi:hypothetical protein
VAQYLATNEGIGIAADHPTAGDDIVRVHRDAGTESIVRIALRIIGARRCVTSPAGNIVLGLRGSGRDQHRKERQNRKDMHVDALHSRLRLVPSGRGRRLITRRVIVITLRDKKNCIQ